MRFLLLGLSLAAFVNPARTVDEVRHAVESRYQHARTLGAAFFERYSDGNGGVQAESGTVYFSRPGRMRWEYESPERKLFLVDGTNVWFYVPADHTASHAKLKESSDWRTPIALLIGKANLSQVCRSLEIAKSSGEPAGGPGDGSPSPEGTVLRCTPRGESAEEALKEPIFLEVDAEGYLTRVVIREPGGVTTEFRFGAWQENIPLEEAKFHFQPPPGVSIVDEESLAGEIH
ncbi:MAG TPA: outer membrane lipoprotein carrier protein LolA [Candidatus Aquilonibacter sp.]|nr:outer membrane lipoprotein carrier protein LolA [Candidatus Aquilonibacter sp.]